MSTDIKLRRGDKLNIRRGPDADIEEAWADEFVVSIEDEKLSCQVLLMVREAGSPHPQWVGIFLLKMWVEWAK